MTKNSAARAVVKTGGPKGTSYPTSTTESESAQGIVVMPIAALRAVIRSEIESALEEHEAGRAANPDVVDGAEMARRLSVSRTTLHRMRVAGMPAIPVADTYRYEPAKVLEWLRARGAK